MKEKTISEPMKTLKELHDGKTEMNAAFIKASLNFTKPKFDSAVKYGTTNFQYATLSEIQDCIMTPLLEEGFFPVHEFYNEDGVHWIKTYLRYVNNNTLGNVVFPIAINNKTMQQIGSQVTYLKRYSLSIICNLSADSDNDGKEVIGDKLIKSINTTQASEIQKLLDNDKTAWELLKSEFGYSKITEIPENKLETIKTSLKLYNLTKSKEKDNV